MLTPMSVVIVVSILEKKSEIINTRHEIVPNLKKYFF
jgi:hypothetical protein